MARLIKFQIEKQSFDAGIIKVDREKVYGWIETVYSDLNNLTCTTATLIDDGQTLLTSGSVASKTVNSLNIEIDKSTLIAKNGSDLSLATLKPSAYDQPVNLIPSSIDELLDLDVTATYELTFDDPSIKLSMLQAFTNIQTYRFEFNYRTDYEASDAFILQSEQNIFILTGTKNDFTYLENIKQEQVVIETEENLDEELDFGML